MTVGEIARRLGLSPSTVSRVLTNHPGISEPTRRRTLALASKLGYRPNKKLQRYFKTIRHESHAVAFLVDPKVHDFLLQAASSFYVRFQWAVQAALRSHGFHMLLANGATDLIADGDLYAAAEGLADGVIAQLSDRATVERLAAHVPLVLINVEVRSNRLDTVIPDVERAARAQMDHLRNLGHRRIACFRLRPAAGELYTSWQDRRFWAEYEQYGIAQGLELPEEYFRPIKFEVNGHPQAIQEFLERVLRPGIAPTAILTYDIYAGELISQLRQRGLEVPKDVSLVGFDDDTHAQFCPLPLTTFRQDFETMAQTAVELLRERMKEPQRSARVVEIAGTLIERASMAPVPSGRSMESYAARR